MNVVSRFLLTVLGVVFGIVGVMGFCATPLLFDPVELSVTTVSAKTESDRSERDETLRFRRAPSKDSRWRNPESSNRQPRLQSIFFVLCGHDDQR